MKHEKTSLYIRIAKARVAEQLENYMSPIARFELFPRLVVVVY
jgi:hypothetical protein